MIITGCLHEHEYEQDVKICVISGVNNLMEDKIIVPFAPILVESTRSIGYSFEAAVADIIDNSISAGATGVSIDFQSNDPAWLCIMDNGSGMTEEELINAMRYGSKSALDERGKDDLGRFGLGMKMASLSQCRKLTVMTKKNGEVSAACWDLDYINKTNNWALIIYEMSDIEGLPGFEWIQEAESGTAVLWQNFDRLNLESANSHKAFDEKIDLARRHVALVFHRFLENSISNKHHLKITFNEELVKGIDPFLLSHPATQRLGEYPIFIGNEQIKVRPYILPIISKLSKKAIEELGGKEELRQRQGFYIYRNKRLIIWGTWFRLIKQNELSKLARVCVDIPNTLDSIWDIDVKKSKASLPYMIRKNLADIVNRAVGRSEHVYRYRGRNVQTDKLIHVWNPIEERDKFAYRINREMPVLKALYDTLDDDSSNLLDSFISMIEETFPYADVYYRMANNEQSRAEGGLDEQKVFEIAESMIHELESAKGNVNGFLCIMNQIDFFAKYPSVISKIREVYGK